MTRGSGSSEGPSVDREGAPVVDPTANVIALTQAVEDRLNDLRKADAEFTQSELKSIRLEVKLRSAHAAEIRKLDRENFKSMRTIDTANGDARQAQALTAVQTLETKRQADADNLRNALAEANMASDKRVADLARTLAEQKAISDRTFADSIAELQRSKNIGEGRQAYTDPAMVEMASAMKDLAKNQTASKSSGEGKTQLGAWLFAAISALVGIGGFILAVGVMLSRGAS